MSTDSANNGGNDDAQQDAPEAGAQAGQGAVSEEQEVGAREAHTQEASASNDDEDLMELGVDMEANPSSEYMRQFDVEGLLAELGADPPPSRAANGPPAAKRSRDNSEVLQGQQVPSTGPHLPYPLVDAMVFKDRIPRDSDIVPNRAYRHMVDKLGPHYKLSGAVTLFRFPESYVDRRLVNEPPEDVSTVTECAEDEALYPNDLIAGAVIGCEPSEAQFLTDSVWQAISGIATSGRVGPYKIVGLYTGIDLGALKRDSYKSDEDFTSAEVEMVQTQGQWFTKFVALAAQLNIPSFDTAVHLLKQVTGLSKTHHICLTQFGLLTWTAELFIQHFPNTVIGVTRSLVRSAVTDADTKAWLSRIPWEHLVFESQAPTLHALNKRDDDHNDSADCLQYMASKLGQITGEHAVVITHRMTMAAVSHYGLLAANPKLLEGTRTPTTPPSAIKMTMWQYQEYLVSRPGGLDEPPTVRPDIMEGIQLPEMPWYVLKDTPQAPLRETQAGPLPDIPEPEIAVPDLRQQGEFVVTDRTEHSWEYLGKCDDHERKTGIRYHANVRTVVDDWKKFEADPNATQDMIDARRKLGNRTSAPQVASCDTTPLKWHPSLIRTLEVARGDKALTEGTRDERVERESIKFSKAEALTAMRWWPLRCQPARAYFVENIHGPARYDTAFLSSPGVDASIRDSFRETLIGSFTDRLDHARLRYFLEEVTKEHEAPTGPNGSLRWPPWLLSYSMDFRRTFWSSKVVLMDAWAKTHFGPNLRYDIDAIELDSDPTKALEAATSLFFGAGVEQIVLFYGKDALDKGKARELWKFYTTVVDHLTQPFGRATVFIVTPVFIYYVMRDWKEAVKTAVVDNEDLKRLAAVVVHPTDLRLQAYFDQHGSEAGWPNEALSLQDRNGTLLKAGVLERKKWAVEQYGLELWAEEGLEPEDMLSEEEVLAISRLSVGQTVRHFGAPTVPGTEYEERMPKPPKARVATTPAPPGVRASRPLQRNQANTSGYGSGQPVQTFGGYPALSGGRTPAVRPGKGPVPAQTAPAAQPAQAEPSLSWDQVKALLLQEKARFAESWQAQLEAFKAGQSNLLEGIIPSTSKVCSQPPGTASPPASLPKRYGFARPSRTNPTADKQKTRAPAQNAQYFSPSSKPDAGCLSTQRKDDAQKGPHAQRQAATVRVAVAASLPAASPSATTASTISAASTPSSATSTATTGTSAATTGTSSGSSASGATTSSAESLPPARQPEEGDEVMPVDE